MILEKVSAVRKQVRKKSFAEKMDPSTMNEYVDTVMKVAKEMVPLVDDIVACLEPPLELDELRPLLTRLLSTLDTLVSACNDVQADVLTDMQALSIGGTGTNGVSSATTALVKTMTDLRHSIQVF